MYLLFLQGYEFCFSFAILNNLAAIHAKKKSLRALFNQETLDEVRKKKQCDSDSQFY